MTSPAQVLYNADVRSFDPSNTVADAVAWRDGILIAVGARADVERIAGEGATSTDASGATVLPGFVDAHQHPFVVALYGAVIRLTPPEVTDIPSFQRVLRAAARDLPPGQWLVATQWNEALLAEGRAPTRSELDDAVPDHPLMALHYSAHRAVANSRALDLAGIGRDTPEPSGGEISRGPGGVPNGLLIERGISRVESLARASLIASDAEGFMERLGRHHQALVAVGVTRVVDAAVPADLAVIYREAARRGFVTVPTIMMQVSTTGYFEPPWDILERGAPEGDDGIGELLVRGPVKLVFDGAPVCSMCLSWWQAAGVALKTWALAIRRGSLAPLRVAAEVQPRFSLAGVRTGIAMYRPSEANEIVRAAADRGFAVATHAIGNDAIDVALGAYEAAGSALTRHGVARIEHAMFLDRRLLSRIADLGAAVVTQPSFINIPTIDNAPSVPGLRNTALRWLLDAKVKVAGSSDHPVVGFDPLEGIRAAVSRRTTTGRIYESDQRIELDEALVMFTRTAAEVSGCLDRCGTLEIGKRADLVVFDGPLTPDSLDQVRVRATVLAGRVVFGALLPAA